MKTMLYHDPDDITLTVHPGEALQLLCMMDAQARPSTITITIMEGAHAEVLTWISANGATTLPLAITLIHKGKQSKGAARVRAVLYGSASNAFVGSVIIPRGSADVDSFLEYRALLFDHARATAIPSLEIEERPLKAAHAAAIGRVDERQLFYLQSRGLTLEQATKMLTDGFLQQLTGMIRDANQQKEIARLLSC